MTDWDNYEQGFKDGISLALDIIENEANQTCWDDKRPFEAIKKILSGKQEALEGCLEVVEDTPYRQVLAAIREKPVLGQVHLPS